MIQLPRFCSVSTICVALLVASSTSSAFSDDEARKAILDLRQKVSVAQNAQLQLTGQIEQLRAQNAELIGKVEHLSHQISMAQRASRDLFSSLDRRMAAFESHMEKGDDGKTFMVLPEEKRRYDLSLGLFSEGFYEDSQKLLESLVTDFPKSGYMANALYWLGCAYYVQNRLQDAITTQKKLIARYPKSGRVPEAMISQAAAEERLGHREVARSLLSNVVKKYAGTPSAATASERLQSLGFAPRAAKKKRSNVKK